MKKLYFVVTVLFYFSSAMAQSQLSISSGTDFYISSGTLFSSNGISLTPSSGFTINGLSLSKSSTVSHSLSSTYISRVYQFSGNTNPFSGVIHFDYDDSELNGLNESYLTVKIYNGTAWQNATTDTRDAVNDYVLTDALSNVTLNELTLVDDLSVLPLKWGPVNATRQEQNVDITWTTYQESNVDHFDVERSTDGINWSTVISSVPATNSGISHQYIQTDHQYLPERIYYRIKETDMDGQYNYSPVAVVNAILGINRLIIYPNPSASSFFIGNNASSEVKMVQLFNDNGALVKTWRDSQNSYNVSSLANGSYIVKVVLLDGSTQQFILQKR